jgi:hypothetical protein
MSPHSFVASQSADARANGASDDDDTHIDSANVGGHARSVARATTSGVGDDDEDVDGRSRSIADGHVWAVSDDDGDEEMANDGGAALIEAAMLEDDFGDGNDAPQRAVAHDGGPTRTESLITAARTTDDGGANMAVTSGVDRAAPAPTHSLENSHAEGTAGGDARAYSSSAVHGSRPADSAGDSNTAGMSSGRPGEPEDSTEAQRLTTTSLGEGEVGMTDGDDNGPGNSEEVEGGNVRPAGSLLAVEGVGMGGGGGTEVESREVVVPKSTVWDAQEPWDVPREELPDASLALKARADALKQLERYEIAERAYGHALRFIDQIEMFGSADDGFSERMSTLKNDCLLEASACALRRADPVRAGELASRALARDPTAAQALKARALAAAAEGDFGAAVRDLEKALESNPGDTTLSAELRDVKQRRDLASRMPRRSGITSSFMGAPGGVSWGTMPMAMGGTTSSAKGGQLFSYPNAGYVASGGLGLTDEVLGETDGAIGAGTSSAFGGAGAYASYAAVGDSGAMDALAMLDSTHIRRDDSPSHATAIESHMDQPGTFNRMGGTPSVSHGMTLSIQKGAAQSDALQLGDESEEDGEEVCGRAKTPGS